MLLLRIVGMLTVIAIGSGIVAWLLTSDKTYLRLSARIAKWALLFTLAVLVLMMAERLIIL